MAPLLSSAKYWCSAVASGAKKPEETLFLTQNLHISRESYAGALGKAPLKLPPPPCSQGEGK